MASVTRCTRGDGEDLRSDLPAWRNYGRSEIAPDRNKKGPVDWAPFIFPKVHRKLPRHCSRCMQTTACGAGGNTKHWPSAMRARPFCCFVGFLVWKSSKGAKRIVEGRGVGRDSAGFTCRSGPGCGSQLACPARPLPP